jgi:hypothetical protein
MIRSAAVLSVKLVVPTSTWTVPLSALTAVWVHMQPLAARSAQAARALGCSMMIVILPRHAQTQISVYRCAKLALRTLIVMRRQTVSHVMLARMQSAVYILSLDVKNVKQGPQMVTLFHRPHVRSAQLACMLQLVTVVTASAVQLVDLCRLAVVRASMRVESVNRVSTVIWDRQRAVLARQAVLMMISMRQRRAQIANKERMLGVEKHRAMNALQVKWIVT